MSILYTFLTSVIDNLKNRSGLVHVKTHTFYAPWLSNGSLTLDLGANVGEFSHAINQQFGCRCVAVEAMSDLCASIGIGGGVETHNVGIAETNGPLKIFRSVNRECNSIDQSIAAEYGVDSVQTFAGVTLESLLSTLGNPHIDLLKVDIEGAEAGLFRSTSDRCLRSIDQITIEFHDFVAGSITSAEVRAIRIRLQGLGFIWMPFSFVWPEADTADFLFVNAKARKGIPLGTRVAFRLIVLLLQVQWWKARLLAKKRS